MRNPFTPLRAAIAAVGIFGVVFVAIGLTGWGVPAANEQPIGEISRWCERVDAGLLREPVNTLGNLGFVISGLAMFVVLGRDAANRRPQLNRFIGTQPVALGYAAATLFLGPGSMAMHGSHTFFGAWIDNVSMVAYILIPWLVNLAEMGRWADRTLLWCYGLLLAGYAAAYWSLGPDLGIGLDLFAASIGLWIVSEVVYRWRSTGVRLVSGFVGFGVAAAFGIMPTEIFGAPEQYWWMLAMWIPGLASRHPPRGRRRYTPWFWLGAGAFLGAYAIWQTGTAEHPWCAPDSLIQAHAIWHLLSAGATWCFFRFLRTERLRSRDPLQAGENG